MANSKRGDVDIEIGGESYIMRPSFEALSEIEGSTGKGIMVLVSETVNQTIKLTEIARIVHSCLRGYDKKSAPSFNAVGDELQHMGYSEALTIAGKLIIHGISGGDKEDNSEPSEKN